MTSDVVTRKQPGLEPSGHQQRVRVKRDRRCLMVLGLPTLTALVLGLWGTGSPSLWTDELVTVDVARRSTPQIWDLLGHVDAVHGLYYLLMHAVLENAGFTPGVVRFPSVVATAVAAGGLAALARLLAGPRTGLLAGLVYACTPVVSQYALEARSYASVTAVAVLATLALVQALRTGRGRWFAAYGAAVVILGALHLFAVLLVGAHLVTVVLGQPPKGCRPRWLISVAGAAALLTPLAAIASSQQGAVEWIRPPDAAYVWHSMLGLMGTLAGTLLVGLICAVGIASARARELALVSIPWLVIPPLALLALSRVEPMFVARYLLFCVPAAALLVAAGLTAGPRTVMVPGGLALLSLALVVQPGLRRPDSKWHDVTPIVHALDLNAQTGDGFLAVPAATRGLASAYPHTFEDLEDVALRVPGSRQGSLHGQEVGAKMLSRRVRTADRIWLVQRLNGNRRVRTLARGRIAMLRRAGLTRVAGRWTAKRMRLALYVREPDVRDPAAGFSKGPVTGK